MPRLTAAEELLAEAEPLELPVPGGKVYAVEPLNAERWLRLMALDAVGMAQRTGRLDQVDPADLVEVAKLGQREALYTTLGGTLDAMLADGVDPRVIQAASRAAGAFHRYGLEAAAAAWAESLGNPAARLLSHTRTPRRTSPTSTSTAEESTTQN